MATYYKEMAKELAKKQATITITDNGKVVKRKAIGTFASRAGQSSYWGVILDNPIDDGSCNGVTCNCIIDFSFDDVNNDVPFLDKLSKALQSVVNQVQYS